MSGPTQRIIESNGIRLNVAEQGKGPLVLLCHGFPESWYSWRHQLGALAAAGFHAVAPDMRGYGKSDRPEAIDQYTIFHLVGDMVGLLDALKAPTAVIVGHDWGASVAWQAARLRPDRFRAVVGLSVPFRPRGKVRPTSVMPRTADAQFYQLYFQEPGVAEAEFERDPRSTVRNMLYGGSGEGACDRAPRQRRRRAKPRHGAARRRHFCRPGAPATCRPGSAKLTSISTPRIQAHRFSRRAELLPQHRPQLGTDGALRGREGDGPGALYRRRPRHGGRLPRHGPASRQHEERSSPRCESIKMLPGCGHWTQQERPSEVNAAIIEFLRQPAGLRKMPLPPHTPHPSGRLRLLCARVYFAM